ncbi:MAG: iron-containing alcohol dehydrogenase [Lachnospiraceae bacterium]|nr:iron-containing alcohol dehydrogenase [Lachnospiraceae bacterium]
MRSFKIQPEVFFGEGSLNHLEEIPQKRILIVTDPFIANGSMLDLITAPLRRGGADFEIFSDVVPDAPIDKIVLGVKACLAYKPQAIVAVGGGSAIDSAKAIRHFALCAENYGTVRLIAIPTTSGTGSEVTSFAVVNDTEEKIKYPLVADYLTADEAILDAELVKSVPPSVTADTGMDVFTHALEAYVSSDHNEFASALAEKAIEICGVFLLRAFLDGQDTHARNKMHVASCLAGMAFNSASLGLNHGMAHQLGAQFHIPHGRANAMLLPHIIEYNADIHKDSRSRSQYEPCVKRYATLAHTLGLSSYNKVMSVRSLIQWVQFMLKDMNIPEHISYLGTISIDEYMSKLDAMADAALEDSCTATNPRTPTKEEIIGIYRRLW